MDLAQLAQFASGTATRTNKTPLYLQPVEEARNAIKIVDGSKVKTVGQQALVLRFGRRVLPLDVIKAGSTRLVVADAQVEEVTAALKAAIADGKFDSAITTAQNELKQAAEKPKAEKQPSTPVTEKEPVEEVQEAPVEEKPVEETLDDEVENDTPDIDGLDLSSI